MTCAEAKQIPILDVCYKIGTKCACLNASKGYALFHAPYRKDHHPSLKLCLKTNRWTDLATGQYGDVVDLVKETLIMTTSSALTFLAGEVTPRKPFAPSYKKRNLSDDLVIKPLEHPALLAYANSRGISADIAKRFCREAHGVSSQGWPYFAIAFASNAGGWELRNKAFKRCWSPKDITTLGQGACVSFFEGYFDFLAYVQLYGYQNDMVYVVFIIKDLLKWNVIYRPEESIDNLYLFNQRFIFKGKVRDKFKPYACPEIFPQIASSTRDEWEYSSEDDNNIDNH